ncbi:MAG: hypothetical protein M3220_00755, partial [Chloroflexota bacterium]|nr:hypothetical protein [Chloroflexota bacterium]
IAVEPPIEEFVAEAAARGARRRPRVRQYSYGHEGKRLHMVIVQEPVPGTYEVKVRGTDTGAFALGALALGGERSTEEQMRGMATEEPPAAIAIPTVEDRVAAESELYYQVEYRTAEIRPEIRFDVEATTRNALERLSGIVSRPPEQEARGVEEGRIDMQIQEVLDASEAPEEARETVRRALIGKPEEAAEEMEAMLRAAEPASAAVNLLSRVVEQAADPEEQRLAIGLMEQLRHVREATG